MPARGDGVSERRSQLRRRPRRYLALVAAAVVLVGVACGGGDASKPAGSAAPPASTPEAQDTENIYAETGEGMFQPAAENAKTLVYVPSNDSHSVAVIDPATYEVVDNLPVGRAPQHVVPSYDLETLWVTNNGSNTLTPIDPATGQAGPEVGVEDPYNLYFTPDGEYALVVAEALERLDFLDPETWTVEHQVSVDCPGVNHFEFTADGRFAIGTCEFSGKLVKLDMATREVLGYLHLDPDGLGEAGMPQDVRASRDGSIFYVADMMANGIHLIDPESFEEVGFLETGVGTHSVIPSRDATVFYVTNRGWNVVPGGRAGPGSISVLDADTHEVLANWPVPEGGSPDMGHITADGGELWVSGRYDHEVYVFDTTTGELTHRIPVGLSPHGLTVWPQPGRYSLGHTGNMR